MPIKKTEEKKDVISTKSLASTKNNKGEDKKNIDKKTTANKTKSSTNKSLEPKKSTEKKKKSSTSKKVTTLSKTTKRTTTRKTTKKSLASIIEYYDLPYRYNQTIVKLLAQTPNMLFVYWDISDDDRLEFTKHYGANFFSETKPVLVIHNVTMNYSFEVEINDFANSWYLYVKDTNCKYEIELGRRPLQYISDIKEDYIYISSSNKLDAPNDHVLFETFTPTVSYRNIKNGNTVKKDFSKVSMKSFYKKIYTDDLFEEINNGILQNPSSNSSF